MNTKLVVTNYITVNIDIGSLMFFPALRRGSAATCLLVLRVRIPTRAWMSVFCVLSGRGLCVGLIARPDDSYRLSCVWGWSWSLDWPIRGFCAARGKKSTFCMHSQISINRNWIHPTSF